VGRNTKFKPNPLAISFNCYAQSPTGSTQRRHFQAQLPALEGEGKRQRRNTVAKGKQEIS